MSKKKTAGIDPALEKAIATLLTTTMNDAEATLTDKMKIIDRSLKLEALKMKLQDDAWGSGFMDDDDDESETQRYTQVFNLGDSYGTESCCVVVVGVVSDYRQVVDNSVLDNDILLGNMDNEQSRLVALGDICLVLNVCIFACTLQGA